MTNNIFQEFGDNPLSLFQKWMEEAVLKEINDPNAMALATAGPDGTPSVRMVLLKNADERGFVFFTNRESGKGKNLGQNPRAELNFHWKSLERQVRISGRVEMTDDAESDAYFATRPRGAQIGAWASRQSQPLEKYEDLEENVRKLEKKFKGRDIPRPTHWGGYLLKPERMEFWIAQQNRLHRRFVYILNNGSWSAGWLNP